MAVLNVLSPNRVAFPPAESALENPNGLLAVGGELTCEWLLAAYKSGVFPWFEDDAAPILWWCPDPRAVLSPDQLKVPRSLAKRIRNGGFRITMDTAFADVVRSCSQPREYSDDTWITPDMMGAYIELHAMGFAHSVEVWLADQLVGGLYGVSLGRMFFGESMFAREKDASKVAFFHLVRQITAWEFNLIDCQIMNDHLASLGATSLPRSEFMALLAENRDCLTRSGSWTFQS
ncbi:MAG: leucyl/phenylalanyl-tRNA--protein transferase [Pseudomonadales bacterium]